LVRRMRAGWGSSRALGANRTEMAILIPDTPSNCGKGEQQVFNRLARDLADDKWIVMHSLGLVHHDKKLWGEIDFALLTTKGIFVIEVKGGRISCKDGKWIHEMVGKEPYIRNESPWRQAKDAMFALKKEVKRLSPGLPDLLFGYGVIMPHEIFLATGPEIEPEVLLDRREFGRNLGFYLGTLQRHWEKTYRQRHGSAPRCPTNDEIALIRRVLRPNVESTFSLGSYLTGLEEQQLQLTNQQIRVSRRIAGNARTVVRGRAGTGKTVLAIERARKLMSEGLNILYLCYNQLLAKHVKEGLISDGAEGRIRVANAHALYRDAIDAAGMTPELNAADDGSEEFFSKRYPALFVDAALAKEQPDFDVLVVDEAQDLLTPEHLDAMDMLVKGGLRSGRWHFFLDPAQNIFGKQPEDADKLLLDVGYTLDELFENCRNTSRVAAQTAIISGIDMATEGAIDGPSCDCVFFRDTTEFLRKFDDELRTLLASGVEGKDVVILSPRKLESSMLAGRTTVGGVPLKSIHDGPCGQGVHFSTMHAFKGLERKVVLAIDLEVGNELRAMLHYCGLSRARVLLRPFVQESAKKDYERMATLYGTRMLKA
jgi:hypothetical protein